MSQIYVIKIFQDKGKYIQLDIYQLVKCIYLCHELKMKQKLSVTYMMTDLSVKKINKNFRENIFIQYAYNSENFA